MTSGYQVLLVDGKRPPMTEQAPRQVEIEVSPEGNRLITIGARFLNRKQHDIARPHDGVFDEVEAERTHGSS
jgi:hypothetical protein